MMQGALYCACSGQARKASSKMKWGICRTENDPPWWRAKTSDGRIRLFGSCEAASKYAAALEEAEMINIASEVFS